MVLSGSPTDLINPMSMFYASEGVAKVWDNFLQMNAKGRNGGFHAKDYYVVRTVSPYFMLDPTEPGAWFITWPGTAGKDNPSGMSRLITGTPLCLEDVSWACVSTSDTLECVDIEIVEDRRGPVRYRDIGWVIIVGFVSTIIAIPDYHTTETGRYLTIQPNTFNQEMVPGYPNLARPPRHLWEYRREEEKKEEKFDWFTSSKDDIRMEVANILKARELGSG
ncbi:hypothetical protein PILCRDRAFT_17225 [Piloderma croceum F 1598]|uniref:Uncharacterized protein n=1 Tax=Piloderma croceum (strain F 1598) TaxID=765440 RepID=A0A0C3ETX6_PILCF|nr:hypothetical protein PILCRDRAFT_17225 [Piloderma croceum F 1598]